MGGRDSSLSACSEVARWVWASFSFMRRRVISEVRAVISGSVVVRVVDGLDERGRRKGLEGRVVVWRMPEGLREREYAGGGRFVGFVGVVDPSLPLVMDLEGVSMMSSAFVPELNPDDNVIPLFIGKHPPSFSPSPLLVIIGLRNGFLSVSIAASLLFLFPDIAGVDLGGINIGGGGGSPSCDEALSS